MQARQDPAQPISTPKNISLYFILLHLTNAIH